MTKRATPISQPISRQERSDKVIIPEEFNGKKVSAVNCSIFTHTSIQSVDIQSAEEIRFVENQYLNSINQYLRIGVDKNI